MTRPTKSLAYNVVCDLNARRGTLLSGDCLRFAVEAIETACGGFAAEPVPETAPSPTYPFIAPGIGPLPPPAARRPTRAGAIRMAEGMVEGRESCMTCEIVDAVAALFGGFAPEEPKPVEVRLMHSVPWDMAGLKNSRRGVLADADGVLPTEPIAMAIAARSNAWEEIKGFALDALAIASQPFEGSEDGRDLEIGKLLGDIVFAMNRPEMGVGPKSND